MIEAEHRVVIDTDIDAVWDFVQDIRQWALLFPGCKDCEVLDDHNSKWVIKVGAGGLVKTVNVLVKVDQWDGPEKVDFTYRLESEPVVGSGSYTALRRGDRATDITLQVTVEGSGQMAPMWEAVSKPLLPQMARAFSGKLKAQIEERCGITTTEKTSVFSVFVRWLKKIRVGLLGRRSENRA